MQRSRVLAILQAGAFFSVVMLGFDASLAAMARSGVEADIWENLAFVLNVLVFSGCGAMATRSDVLWDGAIAAELVVLVDVTLGTLLMRAIAGDAAGPQYTGAEWLVVTLVFSVVGGSMGLMGAIFARWKSLAGGQ